MTMMITKFHKLIQAKIFWYIFIGVIVFTFVFSYGYASWDRQAKEGDNAAALLNEDPVSHEEFRGAYASGYIGLVLSYGQPIRINDEIDQFLKSNAWTRVAALRKASEMGFHVTDDEVVQSIQSNPTFAPEGQFSMDYYRAFVQQFLMRMGISEPLFEQYVREEIQLSKVRRLISQTVLISPMELERTFHALTDQFEVEFVEITTDMIQDSVEVTDQDIREYFEADPEKYTIPEEVELQYVAFPIADYKADVAAIDEADSMDYYNEHLDEFTKVPETNEESFVDAEVEPSVEESGTNVPPAIDSDLAETEEADTNDPFSIFDDFGASDTGLVETLYFSFDEVRTNIEQSLIEEEAVKLALRAADEVVYSLTPERNGEPPVFEEVAETFGKKVKALEPFAARDELPLADLPELFRLSVFNLTKEPGEDFTDAIVGASNVYIMALVERYEPRVPELEEVKKAVSNDVYMFSLANALRDKASSLKSSAELALEGGETFRSAARAEGVAVYTTGVFSVSAGFENDIEQADILLRNVLDRNEGELTELLSTVDSVILGYVVSRIEGDPATLSTLQAQIVDTIRRERSQMVFNDWTANLLEEGNFENLLDRRLEVEEEEGDELPEVSDESA